MAHVERRGQGRWRARYRAPDGRERSRTFERKIDAERFLASIEVAKTRGEWIDPALAKTRLDSWATKWLESVRSTLKPHTVRSYESLLDSRIRPALGGYALGGIRTSDVQRFVGSMQDDSLSPSRIRQAHVVLSLVLDAAVRDGLIARNVARGVKLPSMERREAAYLDPSTVDRIANAMPDDACALLVRLMGVCGLRWGEVAALRRKNVDLLRSRVLIEGSLSEVNGRLVLGTPKSHATRVVPLPPSLAAKMDAHLSGGGAAPELDAFVFTSPNGYPLRYRNFLGRIWRPALLGLGLPRVGVHTLRHSAAAAMISAGATPTAVQRILGHSSAAFTLTVYGHAFSDDLDALAARVDELYANAGRSHSAELASEAENDSTPPERRPAAQARNRSA